ncbi:hypothetical protein LWI28_001756 [Acer negundo]|uniref:Uncharacterized protein n=1 Tax=Acer negundo TaxID=4023 RepID=A0AAD5P0C7_ACENE|nr:hypothetical protein LWI28_001756 [Acer negundo]
MSNLVHWLGSKAGLPVNLSEKIHSLAYSVTSRAAFGKKCKDQDLFLSILKEGIRDAFFQDDCNVELEVETRDEDLTVNVEDVETPLYDGCAKYTKLSAIVVLYKHKAIHCLSDKGFDELLGILRDMLLLDNVLPESLYSTKKLLKVFDLGYQKIHACIDDCCLFIKELEHVEECPKCGESRWKVNRKTNHIYK